MASAFPENYDFIVVGAGPSGCSVAWRLAQSKQSPTVLLVEAGGKNDNLSERVDGDRWITRFNKHQNWGYETVPQQNLDGLVIPYDRGRGLGGSSAINFAGWQVGPADDFDEVARLVGDDEWKWTNAKERYKRLETYDRGSYPDSYKRYLNPKEADHGTEGPLKIGFPQKWERSLTSMMDIWVDAGYEANPDVNSGNVLGISIGPNSASRGLRTTAADMILNTPPNLTILTDAETSRIEFNGKTATGIKTRDGQNYRASKEIVISCGSLDTPKLLMLSGIGPAADLAKHSIPVIKDLPKVGKNMHDHHYIFPTWEFADHTTDRKTYYRDKQAQESARKQWTTDRTGPLAEYGCCFGFGFFKSDAIYQSSEFATLPQGVQDHLHLPTVPTHEIIFSCANPEYFIDPDNTPALCGIFINSLNGQSCGSVTLQSSDPADPCLYDPNFFASAFDRRVAIEATRHVMRFAATDPGFQRDFVRAVNVPESESDEDILAFWRKNSGSDWHMASTCMMGKKEEEGACVDNRFRIMGVQGLRVADMSIMPFIPNNHTQTSAYHIGLLCGDKLVTEYGLDE